MNGRIDYYGVDDKLRHNESAMLGKKLLPNTFSETPVRGIVICKSATI
jgi:hypothetical protein